MSFQVLRFLTLLASVGISAVACSDYELGKQTKGEDLDARLVVDPEIIDFGQMVSGDTASEVVSVSAEGTVGFRLGELEQTGSGAFTVTWDGDGEMLQPGETRDLIVSYEPVNLEDEGLLRLDSDAGEGAVQLYGSIQLPAISIDPSSIELLSSNGETVEGSAWVESIGSAPLVLGTWMIDETEAFEAELDTPVSLEPGEGVWLDVWFTPPEPGTWTSNVTIATNTTSGQAIVPILGEYAPPCLGLSEAWDRGMLDISMGIGLDIILANNSEVYDICVDTWYVYLGVYTQDAAAGDPHFDPGADYPMGTITMAPGDEHNFSYGLVDSDAWWCIEELQITQITTSYEFAGYRVPDVLLDLMLQGDQDGIWLWIANNPTILVGRTTHYLDLSLEAPSGFVELETRNLGRVDGSGWIEEHVPSGYVATGFSVDPDASESDGDGGMIYRWSLDFAGAVDTDIDEHTVYDVQTISYTLLVTDDSLQGRQMLPEPTALWMDTDGEVHGATGSPLVIELH